MNGEIRAIKTIFHLFVSQCLDLLPEVDRIETHFYQLIRERHLYLLNVLSNRLWLVPVVCFESGTRISRLYLTVKS